MKSEHFLTPYTKINSKWIKDLSVRLETTKLLEENISRTPFDINCSNFLLNLSSKAKEIKAKINKWNLIKLKNFYTTKKTISKVKIQPSEWKQTIANEATDKELSQKISKKHLQLNPRILSDPIKKWAKELNRQLSKEDI